MKFRISEMHTLMFASIVLCSDNVMTTCCRIGDDVEQYGKLGIVG